MDHLIRNIVLVLAFGLATASLASAAVGKIPATFDVSSQGAATYTVPIWMPPGPHGLQPDMALTYNSQSQNGLLGVGWLLSGLSSIERCKRTVGQDGQAAAITLTMADKFCLNGNRLRLLSGVYGDPGSTYRSELDDFSTITAYASAGSGPQYFIARDRNGMVYEFGRTLDSRVAPGSSSTPLRWKLNRVEDKAGNNYVVSYLNSGGHAVPATISWTPTSDGSSSYLYTANFIYYTGRTAADSSSGFVANQPLSNTRRLEGIQIQSAVTGAPQTIRRYFFTYDTAPVTQRSRLTQIRECVDDAPSDCLLPTSISYQAGVAGVTSSANIAASSTSSLQQAPLDFNGDNRHDLLYISGTTWYVAFATTGGFSTPISTGIGSSLTPIADRSPLVVRTDC
jgi:hypothetical protein